MLLAALLRTANTHETNITDAHCCSQIQQIKTFVCVSVCVTMEREVKLIFSRPAAADTGSTLR